MKRSSGTSTDLPEQEEEMALERAERLDEILFSEDHSTCSSVSYSFHLHVTQKLFLYWKHNLWSS